MHNFSSPPHQKCWKFKEAAWCNFCGGQAQSWLEDCTLQVLPSGHYLDLELSLLEQKDELEGFYEDIRKGRRPILLVRTQLSVRVHAILGSGQLVIVLYCSILCCNSASLASGPNLQNCCFEFKLLLARRLPVCKANRSDDEGASLVLV
ncbi:UNVERIFIED_CONTAM: hypothetical protein K2H54_025718 [Gekko kuhli]